MSVEQMGVSPENVSGAQQQQFTPNNTIDLVSRIIGTNNAMKELFIKERGQHVAWLDDRALQIAYSSWIAGVSGIIWD